MVTEEIKSAKETLEDRHSAAWTRIYKRVLRWHRIEPLRKRVDNIRMVLDLDIHPS
jgi:hypothetical protein